ncbi:hypothetical protein DFH09DRAFT_1342767 [Mycena vulgaris]|nr:hypothetical protein DFH09DRAFT_1342767 [Mycena vulgaris]
MTSIRKSRTGSHPAKLGTPIIACRRMVVHSISFHNGVSGMQYHKNWYFECDSRMDYSLQWRPPAAAARFALLQDRNTNMGGGTPPLSLRKKHNKLRVNDENAEPGVSQTKRLKSFQLARSESKARGVRRDEVVPDVVVRPPSAVA